MTSTIITRSINPPTPPPIITGKLIASDFTPAGFIVVRGRVTGRVTGLVGRGLVVGGNSAEININILSNKTMHMIHHVCR